MGDVDILRVRADADGGRGHFVRADGLLVDADEYKQKTKKYLQMVTWHVSMRMRCVQTR